MGKAIGHPITRIAADVERKHPFQPVMPGPVQEIAERQHSRHSSSKENRLPGGPALAKRSCHRVHLLTAIAQITVSNSEIHRLQSGMAEKQCLVGCVPKLVPRMELIQILGKRKVA